VQDEDRDLSVANQLGLLMSYHLQAIQHIDQLLEYSNKGMTALLKLTRVLEQHVSPPQCFKVVTHMHTDIWNWPLLYPRNTYWLAAG